MHHSLILHLSPMSNKMDKTQCYLQYPGNPSVNVDKTNRYKVIQENMYIHAFPLTSNGGGVQVSMNLHSKTFTAKHHQFAAVIAVYVMESNGEYVLTTT